MTAKEHKIKDAYGEYWETIKDFVDENGWCYLFPTIKGELEFENTGRDNVCYRPKSLQGIENNNGWVKIESENDLPKKDCDVFVFINGRIAQRRFQINISRLWINKSITHYQPIIKPLNPIY